MIVFCLIIQSKKYWPVKVTLKNNKRDSGFTLIELIIVIVILGILTVVAFPRFLDFSTDARISVLSGVESAMEGAANLVRTKALIQQVENGNVVIENLGLPSDQVLVYGGFPEGYWNGAWKYILDIGKPIDFTNVNSTCSVNELCGVGRQTTAPGFPEATNGANGIVLIWLEGMTLSDLCYAYYYNREDGSDPTTGTVTSGC